jgi:hypothetical protein
MLPSHIERLLRKQVATDLRTKGTDQRRLHIRAAEKAVQSGMEANALRAHEFALEIERRAGLIAEAIRKVLSEVKLSPYSELSSDLVALYDSEFDRLVAEWRPRVREAWSTGDGGLSSDLDKLLAEYRMDIKRLGAAIMEPSIRAGMFSAESIHVGDNYSAGQVGAMGPQAHAQEMSFHQISAQQLGQVDMRTLAVELAALRREMRKSSSEPEQDIAIGQIAAAETAAQKGDATSVLHHLKSAGKWAFDFATKIGVNVASEAIKKASGL